MKKLLLLFVCITSLVKAQISALCIGAFNTANVLTTGFNSHGVTTADFNLDGKSDIAVANTSAGKVSVFLSIGGGSFAPALIYTVGSQPYCLRSADFNNDSIPDLAVVNKNSSSVSILLGSSTGVFTSNLSYGSLGTQSYALASLDFNKDGNLDLAVVNSGSGNITILKGSGTGAFQYQVNYTVGSQPQAIETADFNSDGNADLAIANSNSSNVTVLLGSNGGAFTSAGNFSIGLNQVPNSLSIADLNNDSIQDIAVSNNSNSLTSLIGTGTGSFVSGNNYSGGVNPKEVIAFDFNADGRKDLASVSNSGCVSVILSSGTTSFKPTVNYATGEYPVSLATGDFNGDSKNDLVIINSSDSTLLTMLGVDSGAFAGALVYNIGGVGTPSSNLVITDDFNSDGIRDIATGGGNVISIMLGRASGGYTAPINKIVNGSIYAICSDDFDNDTIPDIVVTYITSGQAVFLGTFKGVGNGTFNANNSTGIYANPYSMVSGDFNLDGYKDLAITSAANNNAYLCFGYGNFGFALNPYQVGLSPYSICKADFNLDGNMDLATANYSGNNVSVLLGSANGVLSAAVNINLSIGASSTSIGTDDFNNDGIPDIAVTNSGTNNVSILLGLGNGSFSAPIYYPVGNQPYAISIADYNSDGFKDISVGNRGAFYMSILQGVGNGTFYSAENFYINGSGKQQAIVSDYLNSDAAIDIATIINSNGGNLNIIYNGISPSITLNGPDVICAGNSITLVANASDNYLWSNGANSNSITLQPDTTSTYTVSTSNIYGCSSVATKTITVEPLPSVSDTISINLFQANTWNLVPVYSSNIITAKWFWGDGTDTVALYPSHVYATNGNYTICVTAYASCGDSISFCNTDTSSVMFVNVLTDIATKINSNKNLNLDFNVYPNPSNGKIQINYQLNSNQNGLFELYSITGDKIISKVLRNNFSSLQIDDKVLLSGIYFYRFMLNGKQKSSGKLVVIN